MRVTQSNDPAQFTGGSDLLTPSRSPWRLSLLSIAARDTGAAFRDLLYRDGLVSPSVMDIAASVARRGGAVQEYYVQIVHSFGQEIVLQLDREAHSLLFVSSDGREVFRIKIHYMTVSRPYRVGVQPRFDVWRGTCPF